MADGVTLRDACLMPHGALLCATDQGLVKVGKDDGQYFKGQKVMVVSRVDDRRYLVGVVGEGRNELVLWDSEGDGSIERRVEVDRFTYFCSL